MNFFLLVLFTSVFKIHVKKRYMEKFVPYKISAHVFRITVPTLFSL